MATDHDDTARSARHGAGPTARALALPGDVEVWATLGFGFTLAGLTAVAAGPVGRFLGDPEIGAIVAGGGLTFAI